MGDYSMREIQAKSLIGVHNASGGWFGANYNMNIYKGCCLACIYCDSRSDCYKIKNFDEVRIKKDALNILERELRSKRNKGIVGTGSMTDHYNPFEERLCATRNALKLLLHYGFGASVVTKSTLVVRDLDILSQIAVNKPCNVGFTITTIDDTLCKKIERNAPSSSERFEAMEKIAKKGVFCGVLLMPILPFINNTVENVVAIVRRAADCGAKYVFTYPNMGVTLRQNQRVYFYERLDELFPSIKNKYIQTYGQEYMCAPANNDELWQAFKLECARLNLCYDMKAITSELCMPYERKQLSFL